MAGGAEVDLVEGEEPLGVVGDGLDHGELVDAARSRDCAAASSAAASAGRWRTRTPGLRPGSVSMPTTGCPARYLATLATSPSCPTTTTTSSGANRNRSRSARSTRALTPGQRNRRRHLRQRPPRPVVAFGDLLDVPAPGGEEEGGLAVRAVPGEQLLVLGGAVDEHGPRGEAHACSPSRQPSLASSPVSTSGETVRLSIRGRFSASRVAGQGVQRRRVDLGVHPQPGGLGLGACLADLARAASPPPRLAGQPDRPRRLRLGPYRVGRRALLGLAARVRAALVDQLLLAAGEFDLAGEFVLGDGALPLDGHRPALVRRPVRLLLDLLAGRGAQRPLHLGFGAQRDDAYGDDLDAGGRQPGLGGQARRDPLPYRRDAVDQRGRQRRTGQDVQRVLLGRLGQQRRDLLQRARRARRRCPGRWRSRGGRRRRPGR